jgi:hypothetical protein
MKIRSFIAASLFALTAAPAAFAGHYADLYVIPVASHTSGENGTNWRSDIAVHNFQSTPLRLELVLIEGGDSTINNVVPVADSPALTVPPNGSRILGDVLADEGRTNRVGAIVIGGSMPFAVTSRSYSVSPSGDTVGQTVVASRDFFTNTLGDVGPNATAYLSGLIANNRFRTNIGFAAGAGPSEALVFDIILRNAEGSEVGRRRFTIAPGTFMQQQFSSRTFGTTPFDAGAAQLRIVSGDGVIVPYASVIDNATADAVFVSGEFPPVTTTSSTGNESLFGKLLRRFSGSF